LSCLPVADADTGVRRAYGRRAVHATVRESLRVSRTQSLEAALSTLQRAPAVRAFPSSSCSNNFRPTVQRSSSAVGRRLPASSGGRETRRATAGIAATRRQLGAAPPC